VQALYADPAAESCDVLQFKDGRVFERYSQPQRIGDQIVGRVWSFRDVTERRRAEQEKLSNLERAKEVERLKELDRFKTQFVNSVAHELWTPLTPIQMQLHMLQNARSMGLSDEQRRSVEVIARNMERLRHLVEELLDGARLQAGRFRVHRVPMNLHTVVTEMVDLFRVPADAAGVRLTSELEPDLPIEGDSNRLIQVLYNLLSNALKFTPRGGHVAVRTCIDGATARVSVQDSGAGLTSEQREGLFQAFSQVHDTMQQTRAGTGLGLYISRAIVEAHNGLLTAFSEGADKGSTFEVSLPLYRRETSHGDVAAHGSFRDAPAHPG
jgi:signal transduction histidine kinase